MTFLLILGILKNIETLRSLQSENFGSRNSLIYGLDTYYKTIILVWIHFCLTIPILGPK